MPPRPFNVSPRDPATVGGSRAGDTVDITRQNSAVETATVSAARFSHGVVEKLRADDAGRAESETGVARAVAVVERPEDQRLAGNAEKIAEAGALAGDRNISGLEARIDEEIGSRIGMPNV